MPSGHDSSAVQSYYNDIYAHYLSKGGDATLVDWSQILAIVGWAVVLSAFFFLLAMTLNRFRRADGLYSPTSFGGYIHERNGRPSVLQIVSWIVVVGWAVWIIVDHTTRGQIY